jgi:hypothetical protein
LKNWPSPRFAGDPKDSLGKPGFRKPSFLTKKSLKRSPGKNLAC